MPFEELDKKILEAAENHHPAYDETAWLKMEKQLDKHLPVEKKKRRRAAFWLLLLFLTAGSAGYLLLNQPGSHKNPFSGIETKPVDNSNPDAANKAGTPVLTNANEANAPAAPLIYKENTVLLRNISAKNFNNPAQLKPVNRTQTFTNKTKVAGNISNNEIWAGISGQQKKTIDKPVTEKADMTVSPVQVAGIVTKPEESLPLKKIETQEQANTKTISVPETKEVIASKKNKIKKGNGLFFSISAAPDVSAAGFDNPGKLNLAYGAGIGYRFGNRLSVQTGFYTVRKIYTATPDEYKAPPSWWTYYPNMEKVEADCKVYEIPVLATYQFANNKKANWFGTAGLSSYLMKKETYEYYYKTNAGLPQSRSWTYNNQNKHFLSVVTLAGGYERTLNKNISLSFSPYVKLPLQGVGAGKIKLNSAGIMVSMNIRPFIGNR